MFYGKEKSFDYIFCRFVVLMFVCTLYYKVCSIRIRYTLLMNLLHPLYFIVNSHSNNHDFFSMLTMQCKNLCDAYRMSFGHIWLGCSCYMSVNGWLICYTTFALIFILWSVCNETKCRTLLMTDWEVRIQLCSIAWLDIEQGFSIFFLWMDSRESD